MLVDGKSVLDAAKAGRYGIVAPDFLTLNAARVFVQTADALKTPILLSFAQGHAGLISLEEAALVGKYWAEKVATPIVLHLDHGPDFETCKSCIDDGFTSVMIDGSHLSFKENIELTKRVVEYAHAHNVVVEGELGQLAGIEDDVKVAAEDAHYTRPEEVEEFVSSTGVDSLAIAIGTSHGAFKFKPEQCTKNADGVLVPPELRFDILAEIEKRLPGFPIVLHGASSVIPKYVKIINDNGGNLADAVGIPEDQLRKAAKSAVCKINIDSDLRLAMTAGIREHFKQHPEHFDPRQYIAPGRDYIRELVEHKIKEVLGSDGKAAEVMALLK